MEVWHTARRAVPVTLNRSTEPVSVTIFITLVDNCSSNLQYEESRICKIYFYANTSSPLGLDLVHLKTVRHFSCLQTLNICVTIVTKTEISLNIRKSVLLMQN